VSKGRQSTFFIAAIVSLGGFLFGFDASVISGVVRFVVPQFGLNELQTGLVVGAPTLAGMIAALTAGPMADVIGRKRVLIILAILYSLSAVGSAFAPNYETLVVARFVGGLAFASLAIAPMYIGEVAPAEQRGRLVSVSQLNIMVGFSAAYFANYFILQASQSGAEWVLSAGLDRHAWRWMLGIETLPALAWLGLLAFAPESPRWLALKGRYQEARATLSSLRSAAEVEREFEEIHASLRNRTEPFGVRVRALFGASMRLPLLIGLVVAIAQQVTGINAIYFYAPTIFEQSGVGTNAAFAQATLIGVINILFTLGAMALIDRLGRRPLLLIGVAGVVFSTALVGFGFHEASYRLTAETITAFPAGIDQDALSGMIGEIYQSDLAFKAALTAALGEEAVRSYGPVLIQAAIHINPALILAGILGFVASFAISLGPVMWVLFSEIFPNRVRGLAFALVGVVNAFSSFLVQLVFPWELSNLGSALAFFVYSALGLIAFVLIFRLLPETRRRTLEQLEIELTGGHRSGT